MQRNARKSAEDCTPFLMDAKGVRYISLWRPSGHCYPLTSGDFLCRQLVVPR